MSCFSESQELEKFFETLRTEDDKVCYGLNSVKFALENMAVDTLLVSDHLFRSKNTGVRREYVQLAEKTERNGIKVVIFSSMNPTGQRLKDLTGVAAILRFSLPGLDDIEELDYDSEEELRKEFEEEKEEEKQSFEDEQLEFLLKNNLVQNVGEYDAEDDESKE